MLGIDLGTTNSVIGVAEGGRARVLVDQDGQPLVPSVVSFHPGGRVLVGRAAQARRQLDAANTVYSVKRLIGRPFDSPEVKRARERFPFEMAAGANGGVVIACRGETYTLSEISAFVLRELRGIAEQSLGVPCKHAVITVPANFNELQRSATKAAGRVAGLDVLRILNEPTAAALAYGYGRGSRERVAVFDLGGGTFDVTLLELAGDVLEVLATAGDTYLGGDDIDALVADQMADAFLEHHRYDPRTDPQAVERLRAAAEWAKCQLSDREEVQLRIEELAYGVDGSPLDLTFSLSRHALEVMTMPLLARTFDVCREAMKLAGLDRSDLDNVILVGGSTRMPLVERMVTEYFGRAPLTSVDPDLVVAQGAAIQGEALRRAVELAGASGKAVARVQLKRVGAHRRPAPGDPSSPALGAPRAPVPSPAAEEEPGDLAEVPTRVTHTAGPTGDPAAADGDALAEALRNDDEPTLPASQEDVDGLRAALRSRDRAGSAAVPEAPPSPPGPPAPPPARSPGPAAVAPIPPTRPPPHSAPPPPRSVPPPPPPPPPPAALPGPSPVPDAIPAVPVLAVAGSPNGPPESPLSARGDADSWSSLEAAPAGDLAAPTDGGPAIPLLLDVTPHSLCVETVEGYCEAIVARNAAVPVAQARIFSTARDDQDVVRIGICQGESRQVIHNQRLGEIVLPGLPREKRGEVQIEVTFAIDADGILGVRAQDSRTGREQSIRINLVGGADEDEIRRMQDRMSRLARPSS